MRNALKGALAVSVCVLAMSVNTYAAEPADGQVIDGSVLTHEVQSETTQLFDWNFNVSGGIVPFGDYYAAGSCGIVKEGSSSVYIKATTECHEKCDTVKAQVTLQRMENSTWCYVTSRSDTESNAYKAIASDTVNIKSGYYYRVVSTHSATKNGTTETGSVTSDSVYIQ